MAIPSRLLLAGVALALTAGAFTLLTLGVPHGGEQITERVSEVVCTAKTPLPDGYRDAFVLSLQMPEDAAGTTL